MKYSFIIFKKEKNLVHHMSKDLSSMESKYDFQIDKLFGYKCLTGQLNQNFCIDMSLLSYNKHWFVKWLFSKDCSQKFDIDMFMIEIRVRQ